MAFSMGWQVSRAIRRAGKRWRIWLGSGGRCAGACGGARTLCLSWRTRCWPRRAGGLAAVSEPGARVPPRSRHGLPGLAEGGIDEEALRDLLVAARPREWPLVFAIDASTYPRPEAAVSPGREWHHHSCPGSHGGDGAAVAGWAFQWLAQRRFAHGVVDRAAGPGPGRCRGRRHPPGGAQIIAHSARLRAAGERRHPAVRAGRRVRRGAADLGPARAPGPGAGPGPAAQRPGALPGPAAPDPGEGGRPRKHGSGSDRFECKNPATWGGPDQELSRHDERYGQVSVMSWGGLHPKLFCRGRFAGFAEPPVIRCHLIRVTVTRLPNGRKVPGPLWLWWAGPGMPGPGPDLARLPAPLRHRAHLPARQAHPGLGQGRAPPPGAGGPLDLADHLPPHPAAPGPSDRRGPPAALGTPPQARGRSPPAASAGILPPGRPRRARRPARQNPPGQAPADPKDAPAPPHPGIPC